MYMKAVVKMRTTLPVKTVLLTIYYVLWLLHKIKLSVHLYTYQQSESGGVIVQGWILFYKLIIFLKITNEYK